MTESAEERKRKRLEAWRRRKQQSDAAAKPAVKVSLSLTASKKKNISRKTKAVAPPKPANPFGGVDDDDDSDESETEGRRRGKLSLGLGFSLADEGDEVEGKSNKKRRRGRWDNGPGGEDRKEKSQKRSSSGAEKVGDTLDKFMNKLQAGALGSVTTQVSNSGGTETLSIDVGGSVMRLPKLQPTQPSPVSGGFITSDQLAMLSSGRESSKAKQKDPDVLYTNSDWESDAQGGGTSEVSGVEQK
jgi:hypothetical protein